MNLPPVDLMYLRERFNELAAGVQEIWEASPQAEEDTNSPRMLGEAMVQLVDLLDHMGRADQGEGAAPAELNTLCEYGLHLLEELSQQAVRLGQGALAAEIERLSLPCALWFARHGSEIKQLAAVVNALAYFANQASRPQTMADLYIQCCELIEAASPGCEVSAASDPAHPWRLLLLNRAIVATRSHNPELMEPAFDAIVEYLPQEAAGFFTEGMEQMAIIDYPAPVREIVGRYYAAYASARHLH